MTTVAPVTPSTPAPNYEFDVYRVKPLCKEGGAGLGSEILGDALIVVAQVS
jgi:hypothetical protein